MKLGLKIRFLGGQDKLMRIINLIENTKGTTECAFAHGLSFYIETQKHKLLVDLGPSEETLRNAEKLGIDLRSIDTVILSHGHYDHSGGIIPFTKLNNTAKIFMQKLAVGKYYSDDGVMAEGERFRYIGIDEDIANLSQVEFLDGDDVIDEELSVFVIEDSAIKRPFTNFRLKERIDNSYIQDEFKHEQYLVIKAEGKSILISGCAHNGIINIIKEYKKKYGAEPDIVISGFHLMKKTDYAENELWEIIDTAKELKKYRTKFYTCHCTGLPAFRVMKNIMGDQLEYVHSGDEIKILIDRSAEKKGRDTFMKWHKFFAWATVICFLLTMYTGWKRK